MPDGVAEGLVTAWESVGESRHRPSRASWPGLTRPSAHHRLGADGRVRPGHDGKSAATSSLWDYYLSSPQCRLDGAEPRGAVTFAANCQRPRGTYAKHDHPPGLRGLDGRCPSALAAPFIRRADAAAPIELRCSLDTAPSHPRNVAVRDFLGKIEAASNGQITTKLFESGSLFPDLQVVKALVQGQVEMACPGTWTITGFVPDADFSQLPALYGRPIDVVHKATDGKGGKFVNKEITDKLHVEVLGGWFDLGFNNWFSTRKPLNSLADLTGMKLRSPGGVLNSFRIRFFGGIPNVTAWPDVPLAMSQGTFDGLISIERKHQQLQAVRFRHAVFVAGPAGHGAVCADGQPGVLDQGRPEDAGDDAEAVVGQPAGLARQHREGAADAHARS